MWTSPCIHVCECSCTKTTHIRNIHMFDVFLLPCRSQMSVFICALLVPSLWSLVQFVCARACECGCKRARDSNVHACMSFMHVFVRARACMSVFACVLSCNKDVRMRSCVREGGEKERKREREKEKGKKREAGREGDLSLSAPASVPCLPLCVCVCSCWGVSVLFFVCVVLWASVWVNPRARCHAYFAEQAGNSRGRGCSV